jgi:hypothetical protein
VTKEGFLTGRTIGNGAFRLTENLLGSGSQMIYLAVDSCRSESRHLASVILAPKGIPAADIDNDLRYRVPGVLELEAVAQIDVNASVDRDMDYEGHHWALVENLPEGEWVPRLASGGIGARAAVALGLSLAQTLERAADAGVVMSGIRPEFIWAVRRGENVLATGITTRSQSFFRHTDGRCSIPGMYFERSYAAPEVHKGGTVDRESLVFTVATMIAEWASGTYPFPDSWWGGDVRSLCEGRHAPLVMPKPLAELLRLALKAEPPHRPSLSYFLRRLALLTADQLAP